jgi:hypothetical protein
VRGPGIPHGVHRSQLTANVDYAPTILDVANARPGRLQDGVSLLPLARDGGKEIGRDILVDNQPGAGHFDAIRSPHWLYAEYANGDRELYDLVRDPDELQSLHADPRYASVREELARRLHALVACKGASCREGPRVALVLRAKARGSCRRGAVRATLVGADVPAVEAVAFRVNGRLVSTDARAPFRAVLPRSRFHGGHNVVRARIAAGVDRLVTRDVAVRICR